MSQAPVVIVGGGIAGCATAYYLALRSIPSIVVEQSCVAAAASGKAGGFLARGWGNGSSTQLHERGYDLHVELAATLGIASYRRLETAQAEVGGRARGGGQTLCPWLDGKVQVEEMDSDTAQVTPLELTTALLDAAVASGFATLRIAKCVGVRRAGGDSGAVVGIDLESGDSLACAQLVVAAGPWSCLLDDWLGIPRACPMEGIWSSSCVWEQQTAEVEAVAVSAPTAVFCGEDANHCHLELYPRPATEALPRGSIYACGFGSSEHMQLADMRAGGKAATAQMVVADEKRVAAASKVTLLLQLRRSRCDASATPADVAAVAAADLVILFAAADVCDDRAFAEARRGDKNPGVHASLPPGRAAGARSVRRVERLRAICSNGR